MIYMISNFCNVFDSLFFENVQYSFPNIQLFSILEKGKPTL